MRSLIYVMVGIYSGKRGDHFTVLLRSLGDSKSSRVFKRGDFLHLYKNG
jgi:hypothetical protein